MATPPTITGIEPEEVRGDVMRLLPPLERALRANAACLSQGLTLRDNVKAYVREVDFTVPDDWVPLTLATNWNNLGGLFPNAAVRKQETGLVVIREIVSNAAAPAAGTVITTLPTGYEPAAVMRRIVEATGATVGSISIFPAGGATDRQVRYNAGNTATFLQIATIWTAADRTPVPWASPLVLEVPVPWTPAHVRLLSARYSGEKLRQWSGGGAVLWGSTKTRAGVHRVEIQRIMGLAPTQAYKLTIGVFPE